MRRKRYLKERILAGVLTVALAVSAFGAVGTEAAAPKYKKAYQKIVNNWKLIEKYDDTLPELKEYFGDDYGFNSYFYYDLDKNGTPEMFVYSKSMGMTEILTYKKKLISLGFYDIARINKAKKEIIVHGHWRGAGGSGDKEWHIYSMNKKGTKINPKYTMDIYLGDVDVYNYSTGEVFKARSVYDRIYNKHIKTAVKLGKFSKKKLK